MNETVSFRGAEIPKFEAEALQEMEKLMKPFKKNSLYPRYYSRKFTLVDEAKLDKKLSFAVKNNKVIGIGIKFCGLNTLPESITILKSLQILNLRNNELETLPESISNLTSLEKLNLSRNNLITLPEAIGNLTSLKILNIGNNKLKRLPEAITELNSLQELRLEYNNLTTLPNSIGNLTSLEYLDITLNPLTKLPNSISNLESLKEIQASYEIFYKNPQIAKFSPLDPTFLTRWFCLLIPACVIFIFSIISLIYLLYHQYNPALLIGTVILIFTSGIPTLLSISMITRYKSYKYYM